jgi:hypothetical protein
LKEAQKNIIETVDHILNNDLVQEYPAALKYVAEIEQKCRKLKKIICFPSFKNKTTKQVQKRHKGISG